MMLIQAAANRWGVAVTECVAEQGSVRHIPSNRSVRYGKIADDAARLAVPKDVPFKPRDQWKWIGQPQPRLDIPDKTNGSARYGIDMALPGRLTATIIRCPVYGGRLLSVDPAPAMAVKGVKKVVPLEDAVAVVAIGYWQARTGLAALKPVWDKGRYQGQDSAKHSQILRAGVDKPIHLHVPQGTDATAINTAFDQAQKMSVRQIEAVYEAPFLAHAPMEPMNGTAKVSANGAELWLPTQYQSMARQVVAEKLGLARDKVILHTTLAGGGFGRRIEIDYAIQAALIAKTMPGIPIKLIWSREEDMTSGYHRGAAMARLQAGLDQQGMPIAFAFDAACPSIMDYSIVNRTLRTNAIDDGGTTFAQDESAYNLGAKRLRLTPVDLGIPVTFWRSVHASTNGFFLEAFLDELAAVAKIDPLTYRRRLLAANPRALAVIDRLAQESGWNNPVSADRHRGVAFYAAGTNSLVGQVIELSVDAKRRIKIHQVTCVVDCGVAINPANVRVQMEGGIIFGLTAALFGELTIKDGAIQQTNFDGYPLLTLAQTPPIAVHILEGGENERGIGGVGEESVPQVAPALTGALFAATGQRIRSLPLSRHGFTLA